MTPIHGKLQNVLPTVVVRDPTIHDTFEHGKFTSYLICIKTDHSAFHIHLSAVRRRFSELLWLHKLLRRHHPQEKLPRHPPTNILSERFNHKYILSRQQAIQDYLNGLLKIDTVLSDVALHLFLQTDLTVEEIDKYLDGSLPEETVTIAWRNSGHLHTSSFLVSSVMAITSKPEEIVMNEEDLRPVEREIPYLSSPSGIEDRDIEGKYCSDSDDDDDSNSRTNNNASSSNGCSNNGMSSRSDASSNDDISQMKERTHTACVDGQRPLNSVNVSDTSHTGRTINLDTATNSETNHSSIQSVQSKEGVGGGYPSLPGKNLKSTGKRASTPTKRSNIV